MSQPDIFDRLLFGVIRWFAEPPAPAWKRGVDKPWLPFGWYRLNDRLHYRCAWLGFWSSRYAPLLVIGTDDRGGHSIHILRRWEIHRSGRAA